jgi:hypothetical protein
MKKGGANALSIKIVNDRFYQPILQGDFDYERNSSKPLGRKKS